MTEEMTAEKLTELIDLALSILDNYEFNDYQKMWLEGYLNAMADKDDSNLEPRDELKFKDYRGCLVDMWNRSVAWVEDREHIEQDFVLLCRMLIKATHWMDD